MRTEERCVICGGRTVSTVGKQINGQWHCYNCAEAHEQQKTAPSSKKCLSLESTGGKAISISIDDDGELIIGIDDPTADDYTDFILSAPDLQRVREWLTRDTTTVCLHGCSERLADNSPASAGRIEWCPACGAVAINGKWRAVETTALSIRAPERHALYIASQCPEVDVTARKLLREMYDRSWSPAETTARLYKHFPHCNAGRATPLGGDMCICLREISKGNEDYHDLESKVCGTFIPMSPHDAEKCANCGRTETSHLKASAPTDLSINKSPQ